MKISALTALATCLVAANAIQIWKRPTVEDAAVNARTLIQRESLTNINTVYQDGDDKGLPASFVEYYADCGDGNPVILAINMATSFKNMEGGSPSSLTVRVGDHAPHEHVNPKYPGSRPHSVAGSPRINLRGKFENVKEDEVEELQKCFLKRHKDAVWWLPGNPIHESHFVKFMVDEAYFLGGFGDTGFIGKIPKELYEKASPLEEDHEETQHFVKEFKEGKAPSNWGYDTYMYHFTIKKSIGSLYKKVDEEIALLKSLITEEEVKEEEVSEEQSKEIFEGFKSQLFKRDEQTSLQGQEDLSNDQIKKLITELETLRSEVHKYGQSLLSKFSSENEEKNEPKKIEGKHHRSTKHAVKYFKKLAPGDYLSEDIFKKNHPEVEHVPEFLKGQTLRVVDAPNEKSGVYTGEEFYKNKEVSEPIPDKVYVIDHHHDEHAEPKGEIKHGKGEHHRSNRKHHDEKERHADSKDEFNHGKEEHHRSNRHHDADARRSGGKDEPKQWKGKHHKFDKHRAKLFKGLIPGEYKSEDIFRKHHPDAKRVPDFLKGKTVRVVDDAETKSGLYTGEEYYKTREVSGAIPDRVYVIEHHKPEYKHHPEPKPDHVVHEIEEPGLLSGLAHVLDFFKGPEPEEEPRPRHHDFKQRRPKNVKFESDLKHDFEGIGA